MLEYNFKSCFRVLRLFFLISFTLVSCSSEQDVKLNQLIDSIDPNKPIKYVCQTQDKANDELCKLMGWLENADPVADVRASLKVGDSRLWAVAGYSVICPGVETDELRPLKKKYGYRVIDGTSDVLLNDEHIHLNRRATEYAEQYNLFLLANLEPKLSNLWH